MQLIATHDERTPLLLADGSVHFAEYNSDASAANAQEQHTERSLPEIRTLHNVSAAIPATSITAPYAFAAASAASAATAPTMQKVQAPLVSGAPEHHLQKDRIAEQMRHLGCSSTLASGYALARGDADGPLFPQGISHVCISDVSLLMYLYAHTNPQTHTSTGTGTRQDIFTSTHKHFLSLSPSLHH